MAQPRRREELSPDEPEQEKGEELPDKGTLSLVDANALPINAAIAAAETLSDDLIAKANPERENIRSIRRSDG
jgi:hypothetical protein